MLLLRSVTITDMLTSVPLPARHFRMYLEPDHRTTAPPQLPVRTLSTLMKSLGHTHLSVLKLDVEGSEYAFLNEALDYGCPPVDQITLVRRVSGEQWTKSRW
jgi:hypothetical protein